MQKKLIKVFVLVCAVLMIITSICACKKKDGVGETTTTGQKSLVDERGFLKDSLPDDLNYDKTVKVLHWNSERIEFEVPNEDPTGDNIYDAIWGRNLAIEERLGVKLDFQEELGDGSHFNEFSSFVEKAVSSGEKTFDVIAAYSRTAGVLATRGLLMDLNSVDGSYIDFEKPWWPTALVNTVVVGNSLYYVSGDVSTNTLHMMYGIYYNKEMMTALGLPDPAAEFVEQKKWTLDKLVELTSNRYLDSDGDGKISGGDTYGFGTNYFHLDATYSGSGMRLVEQSGDDSLLKISEDYFSQKTVNLVDKLGKWITSNDCYVRKYGQKYEGNNREEAIFADGRMMFILNRVYVADHDHWCGLNNVDWLYGLVPTPMYDENQKDYVTVLGNPFTLYGIISSAADPVMSSAVIECWGSEGYRRTTPAIFEVNMKYKYTQEEISARMFDILHRTSMTDLGRIYGMELGPHIAEFPGRTICEGKSWARMAQAYRKPLTSQLKKIADAYAKLQLK